ncbi:beta-L-arabinofuranosidase domain-containing protein [Mucilaginibacter aquaedulcis]|uniref:beta-L-arabinofuranosidase domain-containing protein n=1 Tax=Mucilaginibacter aquaedulcis TaxID=1187081 RepID=UPI0025B54E04|nr:beta-L-arabinofuranosidase domain-containing protein [Mucilaginibacter aquaedulcis]MDN3549993.1 glycoside hydrolase family 127 protein [Mucilaginibacter aquaedulcis]
MKVKRSCLPVLFSFTILAAGQCLNASAQQNQIAKSLIPNQETMLPLNEIKLTGYVGDKLNACIHNRIEAQDIEQVVAPFRTKNECNMWQTEFWGKWITSAIAALRYDPDDKKLRDNVDKAAAGLMATQLKDGYIGNYADSCHLHQWDIWGRKYTLLGLIDYYDLSRKKEVLESAKRLLNQLMTEVGPGKRDIAATGNYAGLPSTSILEPVVLMYNRTGDKRYLDFAEYIVQNEEHGKPKLIANGLAGVLVSERYKAPGIEHGQKAYEMMSCYEGMLELYRVTGKKEYLDATVKTVDEIMAHEINICGGASSSEKWYMGGLRQAEPAIHPMESCVTMTWIKLCKNLLTLTGNPKYMDAIEISMYNAMMGAMMPAGNTFAKYSVLRGVRELGEGQCNMDINCCIANSPRAFMLFPAVSYMYQGQNIYVNSYIPGKASFNAVSKKTVTLEQITDYPKTGGIQIIVHGGASSPLTLHLRIPQWSKENKVSINNVAVDQPVISGEYLTLNRTWKDGDMINIKLDMRGRIEYTSGDVNKHFAIMRGPVVLARDNRLNKLDTDESLDFDHHNVSGQYINLTEIQDKPQNIYLAYKTDFYAGSLRERSYNKPVEVVLCDYASAGNSWNNDNKYNVWSAWLLQP